MSLGKKVYAAPARTWLNWPVWGGMLAMLLLSKHAWVLFGPAQQAIPATTVVPQSARTGQLFGVAHAPVSTSSLNGIRPIGIFARRQNGFAVMQTPSGQVGVGVGGQVAPGIVLAETHAGYVILESNGVRHRVDLVKAPVAAGGIIPENNKIQARSNTAAAPKGSLPMPDHAASRRPKKLNSRTMD